MRTGPPSRSVRGMPGFKVASHFRAAHPSAETANRSSERLRAQPPAQTTGTRGDAAQATQAGFVMGLGLSGLTADPPGAHPRGRPRFGWGLGSEVVRGSGWGRADPGMWIKERPSF
jgi:hypothetical protein